MPNSLTGDFEAVLQVSGSTLNRLMASMHQNAFSKSNLPSFPHSVWIRIGDDHRIDGVRGSLQVQCSVPRIELIQGASDRFNLEVSIRARFRPDAGSQPLPAFIHGTVRATYQMVDIDPNCFGWAGRAANYLWIRVIKDSVQFTGTAEDDAGPAAVLVFGQSADSAAAEAAKMARITRQIAEALATRFEAAPHPVSKQFRRGAARSLTGPTGASALATPLGLSGEPVGDINSLDNLLLDGADFGIGLRLEVILGLAQPALDAIRAFSPTIKVHVSTPWPAPDIDTVYHVHINPPTIEWQPLGWQAVIKIRANGSATTNSILPNATFEVEQDVILNFDAAGERLWLTPGAPHVTTHASGLGSSALSGAVYKGVTVAVQSMAQSACAQAQPALDAMITRKQGLIDQLRTIDDQAYAWFDEAVFLPDGMILRGKVSLTMRLRPAVSFEKTVQQDGYSALLSWIPGGRIDKLEWTWSWAGQQAPGAATYDDRFVLRRPPVRTSRWGAALGQTLPLPGIDGSGQVCLWVKGVQVDAVTGALVPVESMTHCTRFGLRVSAGLSLGGGRLFLRDMPELSHHVPFPQLALVDASRPKAAAGSANTLLLYLEERWDGETAATLKGALQTVRREDAGLTLLVLFREGVLEAAGPRLAAEVEEFGQELGVTTLVNEDVRGSWSAALALASGNGRPAWRLLSPGGGVTWMHQGRATEEALASALQHCLIPSPPPTPAPLRTNVAIGMQISAQALSPGTFDEAEAHCPPVPLGRLGHAGSVVSFVQPNSMASVAQLRKLASQYRQGDDNMPAVLVVVDGANAREVARLQNELGFDFATLPDATGTITDRFGIGVWPTTVSLDGAGTVYAIESSAVERPREAQDWEEAAE